MTGAIGRHDVEVLFDIQLIFELAFHYPGHAPRLPEPAAKLIGHARQTFRAQYDEPDQQQNYQLPEADP